MLHIIRSSATNLVVHFDENLSRVPRPDVEPSVAPREMLNKMKRVLSEVRQKHQKPESVQSRALRIKPIGLNRGQFLWVLNGSARQDWS
jgi:hypothetical protein